MPKKISCVSQSLDFESSVCPCIHTSLHSQVMVSCDIAPQTSEASCDASPLCND